jgi:phosphoribosylglycinamide formyltransferase 1
MSTTPLKLVVLISGNGGNLQAIINAIEAKTLNAEIVAVFSNKAEAYGLIRAKQHGLFHKVILFQKGMTREQYDQQLLAEIIPLQPDYIVLAGFMRILSAGFINRFPERILNIHPSLLPKYPGLHTHEKAIANQDQLHGCTVHLVTEDLDAGPILGQMSLEILAEDTPESLQQRVFALEHQLYPAVIQRLAEQYTH